MELLNKLRAARLDRRYPSPSTWTVDELRRQVDRKRSDLRPWRAGTNPTPAAAAILDEGEGLRDELAELHGDDHAPRELVDRWLSFRSRSIKGASR